MGEYIPFLLKTAAIGFVIGFVLGILFKKVTKMVVFLLILVFILIQYLIYNGIIDIDWLSIEQVTTTMFQDKTKDIDTSPVQTFFMANLPYTITGIIGFLLGVKKG